MPPVIISTLAQYQTRFWLPVARMLEKRGHAVTFLSCDTLSTRSLEEAGMRVVDATMSARRAALGRRDPGIVCRDFGIADPAGLLVHERFAFGLRDSDALLRKLAGALVIGEKAIRLAARSGGGMPVLVQELGGFASVIGFHYAAMKAEVASHFIEPSVFKGRFSLSTNTLAAPVPDTSLEAPFDGEVAAYCRKAVEHCTLVVPEKDRHHYAPAAAKLLNRRNLARLAAKVWDKYMLGAEHEFGAIGHHVKTHLRMLATSMQLRSLATPLDRIGRFVYYPLHVPGDVALTLRSPEYLDQLSLLDYLCRTVPHGVTVAAKEHPAMLGAVSGSGLRALAARYDNFALIAPNTPNYAVLGRADAIVTVNSKSGAEAGLLGRQVLTLGDAFYRDAPFSVPVDRPRDIGPALVRLLDAGGDPPDPRATEQFFADLWAQTYPGELYAQDHEGKATFAASLAAFLAQRLYSEAPGLIHVSVREEGCDKKPKEPPKADAPTPERSAMARAFQR